MNRNGMITEAKVEKTVVVTLAQDKVGLVTMAEAKKMNIDTWEGVEIVGYYMMEIPVEWFSEHEIASKYLKERMTFKTESITTTLDVIGPFHRLVDKEGKELPRGHFLAKIKEYRWHSNTTIESPWIGPVS